MPSVSSTATRTLVVWVAIATLSGLAAMLTWRWTVATADNATHTLLVQQQLAGWLSAAQDLENGERGYLLTKDESYLKPYRSAKEAIDKIHADLKTLVSGNPEQLAVVESIAVTLHQRLAVIEKAIADFSSGNTSASAQIAETAAGSQVMDRLREQISTASDQEEKLFNKHIGQFQNQSFWLARRGARNAHCIRGPGDGGFAPRETAYRRAQNFGSGTGLNQSHARGAGE